MVLRGILWGGFSLRISGWMRRLQSPIAAEAARSSWDLVNKGSECCVGEKRKRCMADSLTGFIYSVKNTLAFGLQGFRYFQTRPIQQWCLQVRLFRPGVPPSRNDNINGNPMPCRALIIDNVMGRHFLKNSQKYDFVLSPVWLLCPKRVCFLTKDYF